MRLTPVHSIVQGAPTHTTHDAHVAVDTPLGTRENHYRPSKPTTMATTVANQQQQSTLLRDPMSDPMPLYLIIESYMIHLLLSDILQLQNCFDVCMREEPCPLRSLLSCLISS
eukprot:scaffold79313_cov55-Attheya_sp.AAC.6